MKDFSKSFKQLDFIFIVFFSLQIFAALVFYILRDMKVIEVNFLLFDYLALIILIINTLAILLAKYIFTARNKIDKKLQLDKKCLRYKEMSIFIITVLVLLNMINIVVFLLTGLQVYLLVAILVLILYIVYRPSKIKFSDTSLSSEEKKKLFSEQST